MEPTTFPSRGQSASSGTAPVTGEAAGVPFVALPPADGARADAPVVIGWHLLDPPRTEAAFAASLPLTGLGAWRVYLGLPLSGSRLPAGGFEELASLGSSDAVLNLYQPVVEGALDEFPAALSALRGRLGLESDVFGLLGGSIGAAVAQLVLAEGALDSRAAVLVSPLVRLRTAVDAMAERFAFTYPWTPAARAVADRLDFVARAGDVVAAGAPAVLLVVGEQDGDEIRGPAAALAEALGGRVPTELAAVPEMAHALAEEPGLEPAPQSPSAAIVDGLATAWFRHHLTP